MSFGRALEQVLNLEAGATSPRPEYECEESSGEIIMVVPCIQEMYSHVPLQVTHRGIKEEIAQT